MYLGLDALLLLFVLLLELLSVVNHLLDFLLRQTSLVVGDGDLVLLSGALIGSRDVEDTVGIDVEGDLDLGDPSWGRGDSGEVEFSQEVVVLGHSTLSLEDLDEDTRLVVRVGGESLRLLGGDGCVTLDKRSHNATSRLDT